MQERRLRASVALHARPLDRFVRTAREFTSRVTVRHGARSADGRSVVQLLLLAVTAGEEVALEVEGADEGACVEALAGAIAGAGAGAGAGADAAPARGPTTLRAVWGTLRRRAAGRLAAARARVASDGSGAAAPWPAPLGPAVEGERLQLAIEIAGRATDALAALDLLFADVFRAQRTVLDDPSFGEAMRARIAAGDAAEAAVASAVEDLERRLIDTGSALFAARGTDAVDVGERILDALDGGSAAAAAGAPRSERVRRIMLVEEATPSLLATVDPERVAAVVSHKGGPTSHAAIVAAARGVALLFLPPSAFAGVADGETILVTEAGEVVALPPGAPMPQGRAPAVAPEPAHAALPGATPTERARPARTRDGRDVALRANLGAPGDLGAARNSGALGCGLLRTELLYAGRLRAPSVDEQADLYARVAAALGPHPLVVRLFDAGSDKPLPFLPAPASEPNPQLGRRGVQLLREHPDVARDQLLALAAARARTGYDVRGMIPMVADTDDVDALRALAPADLPLGAMIELPAAAVLADLLAPRLAFVSIGTNDLSQYTLARDRGAGARAPVHPAVMRLVHATAQAARAAGIECSVCGELGGDPTFAPVLVALGVGALSMAPARIPEARAALAAVDVAALERRVPTILAAGSPSELRRRLEEP